MPNGGAIPPIEPDELLYRRIQAAHYDAAKSEYPEFLAFRPNEHDLDGLSLSRAKMMSPKAVALGRARPGSQYYAAAIQVSAITGLNLSLVTDDKRPLLSGEVANPAHVVIPELNAAVRRDATTAALAQKLSRKIVLPVYGPFSLDDTP